MTLGDDRCLVRCPNVNQRLMMNVQKPKTPGSLRLIISEPTKTEKYYADPMLPHAVVIWHPMGNLERSLTLEEIDNLFDGVLA